MALSLLVSSKYDAGNQFVFAPSSWKTRSRYVTGVSFSIQTARPMISFAVPRWACCSTPSSPSSSPTPCGDDDGDDDGEGESAAGAGAGCAGAGAGGSEDDEAAGVGCAGAGGSEDDEAAGAGVALGRTGGGDTDDDEEGDREDAAGRSRFPLRFSIGSAVKV